MASFLVIGMGRFGRSIATELYQMKHDVLVIDKHEESIVAIVDQVTDAIIGDAKDETVLRSLDIYSFDGVIVAMGSNIEDSVLTTIMLKEMGAKLLVCKARNEWHMKILTQIGADKVVRPEFDMGKRVAHSLAHRNTMDYLEISPEFGVIEIITPNQWIGKTISKNNLRRKYGITVMAIRERETGKVMFSPNADAMLHEGAVLTVIGSTQDLDAISALK